MTFLRVNIGEYFKIRRLLSMSQTGHRSQLAIMESIDKYMTLLLRCYFIKDIVKKKWQDEKCSKIFATHKPSGDLFPKYIKLLHLKKTTQQQLIQL